MEREAEQQRETEVGEFLRTHRLRAGLTLSAASDVLCIREAYLKAIEDGRLGDLPGPTYVAGFIRTYSEHLGLDGNEVVRQLKAEPLSMDASSELRFPSPMSEGGMPSGAILLLGVFVALFAYGVWYVSSSREDSIAELISPIPERLIAFLRDGSSVADPQDADQHEGLPRTSGIHPAAPGNGSTTDEDSKASQVEIENGTVTLESSREGQGGDVAVPTDSKTATPESLRISANSGESERQAPTTPAPLSSDMQANATPVPHSDQPFPEDVAEPLEARIVLRAKDENWVEIREENTDRLIVARLFKPGDTFDVPNTPGLRLLTGNAGGLVILVDGETVPPLGKEGMVRRNIPLNPEQLRSGVLARN